MQSARLREYAQYRRSFRKFKFDDDITGKIEVFSIGETAMNNQNPINNTEQSKMINANLLKDLKERSQWYYHVFHILYYGGKVIELCASNKEERVKAEKVRELFESHMGKYGREVQTLADSATDSYIVDNEALVSGLKDDVEKCAAEAVKKFDEQKEMFLAELRPRKGLLTRALRYKGLLDAEFDE